MRVIWIFVVSGKVKLIGALLDILYALFCKDKRMLFVLSLISGVILWVLIGMFTFHNTDFSHPFLSLLGAIAMALVGSIISFFVAIAFGENQSEENANQIEQNKD